MTDTLIPFCFEKEKIYAIIIDGREWFVAKHICDILEYTNSRNTIKTHCEKGGVQKRYIPTKSGMQEMTIINLPNLIRLIVKSKNRNAVKFEKWVFEKVLPEILRTGKYDAFKESTDPILQHRNEKVQKQNSKIINGINYQKGGVEAIKNHNIDLCKLFTTKRPSEIRKIGREQYGLKASECQSAKSVLRILAPQYSQSMSFVENVLKERPDKTVNDIKETAMKALSLYDSLLKDGIVLDN